MSVCRKCLFFIPGTEMVERARTPMEIAKGILPVLDSRPTLRGTCLRYPMTAEKWQDEWCGEWKEKPQ